MKLMDITGEDGEPKASSSMYCPLCSSVATTLFPASAFFEKLSPLSHALQPKAAAHIASITSPPLPSRGPPSSYF
jgi:hypothetical protein